MTTIEANIRVGTLDAAFRLAARLLGTRAVNIRTADSIGSVWVCVDTDPAHAEWALAVLRGSPLVASAEAA
jgi:hypothetical protein